MWNKGRGQPPNVHQLGPEAWQSEGIKVLGTPSALQFSSNNERSRVFGMSSDCGTPSLVPDLQRGWQFILQIVGPRAHMIRTLPPELSIDCASTHDDGMWKTSPHCRSLLAVDNGAGTVNSLANVQTTNFLRPAWSMQ